MIHVSPPVFRALVPLPAEEIFNYELGGAGYAVKSIVF